MYGHNSEINHVSFSKKGDFFSTGGADSNILIWKSSFCKPKGEEIKEQGLCSSGHRTDDRTKPKLEECMKKTTKVTPTVTDHFY